MVGGERNLCALLLAGRRSALARFVKLPSIMTIVDDKQEMLALLRERGIRDERVLVAMGTVPRERFAALHTYDVYGDHPLELAFGQTISQPYIVARMIEALRLRASDRVLEIGTGSGYSAAVLAHVARHVDTVERIPELAARARARLSVVGYHAIDVHCGDGTFGWPARAPYDAIVVTAGGPEIPKPLLDQVVVGGRLVMPVGSVVEQRLLCATHVTRGRWEVEDLGPVRFVPLVGVLEGQHLAS